MTTQTNAQRPVALFSGLVAGCAAASLPLFTYWTFAPLFVLAVIGIAWMVPHPAKKQFALGATAALLAVVVFIALGLLLVLIF